MSEWKIKGMKHTIRSHPNYDEHRLEIRTVKNIFTAIDIKEIEGREGSD